jgi:hypothetical protein
LRLGLCCARVPNLRGRLRGRLHPFRRTGRAAVLGARPVRRVAYLTQTLREIRQRNAEKAENLHKALTSGFVAMGLFAIAVICALAGQ